MDEDDQTQEHADRAVAEIQQFIDTENQGLKQEHFLQDRLESLAYIINHIDESLSEGSPLIELNTKIDKIVNQVRDATQSFLLKGTRFVREEEEVKNKLREDTQHRDWKAVRKDLGKEEHDQEKSVRVHLHELRYFRIKFIRLRSLMKQVRALDTQDQVLHYYTQLYNLFHSYQTIF